jgi:PKHD-type hydroxylase
VLDALASEILFRVRFHESFREHVLPAPYFSRPIFNRYDVGMAYGPHFDNAIIGTVRTDVSVTVFLSPSYEHHAEGYTGGILKVGDRFDSHEPILIGKEFRELPGTAVVYPTSAIHEVTEVTQGSRLALVFWVQSLVRDPAKRALLRQLGDLTRWASTVAPECREAVELGQVRSNLLRLWMD